MGDVQKGVSWLHRWAAMVAVLSFTSITLGALMTSNANLGLASFRGGPFQWAQFSGGQKYEPAFRLLITAEAILAAVLAVWFWLRRETTSTRALGLATAIAAGLNWWFIGVPLAAPPSPAGLAWYSAITHTSFGLAVCLAFATRTDWKWRMPKSPDIESPSLRSLLVFTTSAVFVSSILGTQTLPSVFPHLISGCTVTFAALWVLEIAFNKFASLSAVKIPAIILAELAAVELFLGIVSHSMELNARVSPQPMPGLAVINATHAAVAAMMLAASLFATLQAFRYLAPRSAESAAPAALPVEAKAEAFDTD